MCLLSVLFDLPTLDAGTSLLTKHVASQSHSQGITATQL